jgi:hypothetical protein
MRIGVVHLESTMRIAAALIRANKDFDLIVVPGMGRSNGGRYGQCRMWKLFVEHLHGGESDHQNVN